MNPIEMLRDQLARRFPGISVEIDPPADPAGFWYLDVRPGEGRPFLVVEWKPELGFGVSTPSPDDYGTNADELYPDSAAAFDRVVQLVLSGGPTLPPGPDELAKSRHLHKILRGEFADRVGASAPRGIDSRSMP